MQTDQIPPKYVESVKLLITMNNELVDKIHCFLLKSIPWIKSDELIESLSQETKDENIEKSEISGIIDLLTSLLRTADEYDISTDQLINSVYESVTESEAFSELQDKKVLQERLVKLIDSRSPLKTIAKSYSLMTEYEHLFIRSRILTDIRPVFDNDLSKGPVSAVVVHTLKLEYVHEGEQKNFYVSLDDNDIKQLQIQLNRTTEKVNEIQKILNPWKEVILKNQEKQN
jgi:hypothetical protein